MRYTSFQDMTHEESWNAFIDELRAYVQEHHHFPNKHTRLLSKVKYTRKKINDGTLEEWKKEQFLEVAKMRDMIAAEWMYHPYHFEMYQS